MLSELLDQATYDEYCTNNTGNIFAYIFKLFLLFLGVCILFFLPHMYDSSASKRNGYLDLIKEIAEENKRKPLTYLWS